MALAWLLFGALAGVALANEPLYSFADSSPLVQLDDSKCAMCQSNIMSRAHLCTQS